jgi:hypothetical protein
VPPSTVGWVERSETQHKISSRLKKKEQTIRQRRFWEHLIREDQDFGSWLVPTQERGNEELFIKYYAGMGVALD